MNATRRELLRRHFLRGLATGAIAAGVFDICLYAVMLPAVFPVVAVCAVIMIALAVLAVCRQTRAIQRLQVSAQQPGILPVSAQTVAEWQSEARRLGVTPGPCAHAGAVPVDLPVTGETVAWLCPQCDAQLPAEWKAG